MPPSGYSCCQRRCRLPSNAESFTASDAAQLSFEDPGVFISLPLTFFLVVSTIRTPKSVLRIVDLAIVCGGLAGLLAVQSRGSPNTTSSTTWKQSCRYFEHVAQPEMMLRGAVRVAGATAHPIAFATLLAMLLPLSVVRAFEAPSRSSALAVSRSMRPHGHGHTPCPLANGPRRRGGRRARAVYRFSASQARTRVRTNSVARGHSFVVPRSA